ncbi:M12 family metallo-peptidase [Luteimonas sp. RD2P54]|uniref:M12 family metallo-peptidase n=1 Tax=Luteimonas endophytica TaxID=3042023 RepID=A0ABT6J817_9GAMM|nr:M12 family metallo-peptidase [Luteimonas endophytica]MDH5822971.1 M12 family metallo-peptidase [Luteimonas endophytica]
MSQRQLSAALALALAACLGTDASAAEPPTLFSPLPESVAATAGSDRVLTAIRADRAVVASRLVAANAAQVAESTELLLLELEPGLTVRGERQIAYRNPDGTIVWSGLLDADETRARLRLFGDAEVADAPEASVLIVRNGDRLTGTVRAGARLYRISPLAGGGHVVARVDEALMPADHPAGYRPRPASAIELDPAMLADKANTVIRVGVLVANSAASAIGDVTGFANLAVAESNQGFANSGVQVTLQLAGVYTTAYNSAGFSNDLYRFAANGDGQLDGWHATRNSIAADVNVLVINNSSSCGIGYMNSNANSAFSVVHYSCATGYYSFGHEIGHNFGAHHNPEAPANNTTYAYGHGYLHPGSAWRTIMAYNCSSGCSRINYWSNPNRTYGGAAMGTTARHDNARLLNGRRGTVAGFR